MALEFTYYSPGPVVDRFLNSDSFVVGLRGPIGSGKSTAAVMKILEVAARQPVAPDGLRHSRFAVIRNSYPELKTTTIKTWHQWVPLSIGSWQGEGPPTHRLISDGLDIEVMFVALDRPEDVRKLLSMELTGAWVNEAREIPKDIIDGLTGRVGRYPASRDGGCIGPQIVMDTNSPDVDHWWYVLAERDVSNQKNAELVASVDAAEAEMREAGLIGPNQRLFEFLHQPSGLAPDAENLENLNQAGEGGTTEEMRKRGRGYYVRSSAGKSEEWIKVYVRGEYGFVQDGRPIYPEYRDSLHCKAFEASPGLPLSIGIDFGLTPAATIGQRTLSGQHRVRHEIVTDNMGAKRFGNLLASFLRSRYSGLEIDSITGDPAGEARAQTDETTPFEILKTCGIYAKPASTNDYTVRREAVAQGLGRITDGLPGWIVHPECGQLRRGMAGAYRYKRIQIVGDERFHDKPDKNMASHVCEAEQYRMIGCGEGQVVLKGARRQLLRPAETLM